MPPKVLIVGAGPVGSTAALYAAVRGYDVEIYELRPGYWPDEFYISCTEIPKIYGTPAQYH